MKTLLALAILCLLGIYGCSSPHSNYLPTNQSMAVAAANNQFAFEFYNQLDKDQNMFFSPYSISSAFGMVYEGAKGQTAEELKQVFHFPDDNKAGYSEMFNALNGNGAYTLEVANALWVQKDFSLLDSYQNTIKIDYHGTATNLDFANTEASRQTINSWVEQHTSNKIQNLIGEGMLTDQTKLVLTNAIYFKGAWAQAFEAKLTTDADFKRESGQSEKVKMMHLYGKHFNYTQNDDLQMIELPYKGDEISMVILLPKKDISSIQSYLNPDSLSSLQSGMGSTEINVFLPRFKFKTSYELNDPLIKMGMKTAFTSAADLSGVDGRQDLMLSFAVHQAYVEVNEEGTVAAAATAIGDTATGIPKQFNANHPFVFLIRQKATGNILFMGRVNDPKA